MPGGPSHRRQQHDRGGGARHQAAGDAENRHVAHAQPASIGCRSVLVPLPTPMRMRMAVIMPMAPAATAGERPPHQSGSSTVMSAPEAIVSQPIRVSGRSSSPGTSTRMPSSSTPAVWAKATVRPGPRPAHCSAGADQVGRHERLAMPRRQGMGRTQSGSEEHRERHDCRRGPPPVARPADRRSLDWLPVRPGQRRTAAERHRPPGTRHDPAARRGDSAGPPGTR